MNPEFTKYGVPGLRKYIVDVSGGLPTILMEINPADSLIKKSYFYANGEVLMQYNGNHKADKYFYLHDRLGSVRQILDKDGLVVKYYTFDAFGVPREFGGSLDNPFMFTGQWFDPEIGQYYLRARQYDPVLMRFSSRDPIVGKFEEPMTLHKYLYCENEPVNRIDPLGLWYTTVHNQIIDRVFGYYGIGTRELANVKRGSAYVDSYQFQDAEHAYMHAMTPSWTTYEYPSNSYPSYGPTYPKLVQHVLSKQETLNKMVGFIISELDQYDLLNNLGDTTRADFHLGEAAHPIMDFTSPAHDLKPWAGTLPEYAPHLLHDFSISERDLRDTSNFTRNTLERLHDDHDALSGWDWNGE